MAKSPRTRAAAPARTVRVQRLEALVEGQAQVLEMISRGLPLAQILEAIALWVEGQSRDGVLVSLLLLDAAGQHVLHGAAPSLPQTYSSAIHGLAIGPAVGSCGTAAYTKHPVIVEDIASDPLWADYRELALSHGLRACWSTPLLASDGHVLGTFAMYYRQPRSPSADDYQLIRLVTRTATLAIEHQQQTDERERLLAREQQARRQAEESGERYRTLFDSVPIAIYSCRADGVIEEFNQRAVDLWGREPTRGDSSERYCGSFKLFYPDGRPMSHEECPMARALRGETIDERDAEILVERPDGARRNVMAHPQVLRNERGEIVGAINCLYDITERKQAEQAAAHLAAIVSSSADAIASKTLAGIITSWNASAQLMFGYTPQEIIGQSVRRLIPSERQAEEDQILARLKAGERIEHFETVRMTKDGRLLDVSLTISPIRNRTGAIIGASKIVRDISERKRLEREREELLGIVAHDLGNPVAAMKARVQLLEYQVRKGKPVDASALQGLGGMVGRMERLVRDLRDAESIQRGGLVLLPGACDLTALCRREAEAAQMATERPVTLALPGEPLEIAADCDRIGQVIGNFLSNALKYSAADRPVELRLSREEIPAGEDGAEDGATVASEDARTFARVSVRDEGPGIPPEAVAHLFERFYRAPGIEVQHGERRGLGLGLYICRQLIERHGGQVGVESEVGKGSTFWFRLPLAESSTPQ